MKISKMLYRIITVLGVVIACAQSTESIMYSKNRRRVSSRTYINPLKELYENIDNIWKNIKHIKDKNLTSIDYSEISAPPLYDYPEIWWTEQPLKITTKPVLDINKKDEQLNNKTNSGKILKPIVIKKTIKVVNNLKRLQISKNRKTNVTEKFKRIVNKNKITTKVTHTREREKLGQYYYIVNKDDKKGDVSIEVKGNNLILESRKNKTHPGVHALVVAGLLIKNDTALSDFDYVIYDKSHPDPYGLQLGADYVFNDTEPISDATPIIIKILKNNEVDETLKQLNSGAPLLVGPKNSNSIPTYEREGIHDINIPLGQMGASPNTDNLNNIFDKYTTISDTNTEMNKQFNDKANSVANFEIYKNNLNKIADLEEGIKINTTHEESLPNNNFPHFAKDVGFAEHPTRGMMNPNNNVEKSTDPDEELKLYYINQTEETSQNSVKRELSTTESIQTAKTVNTPSFKEDPDAFLPTVLQTDFDDMPKKNDEEMLATMPTLSTFEVTSEIPVRVETMPGGPGPPGTRTWYPVPGTTPEPLSPYVHSLINKMASLRTGCFSVSLLDVFEMMALKPAHDAGVLLKGYRKEVENMLTVDRMYYLGRPWVEGLEELADYLSRAPIDVLQDQSKILYHVMLDRHAALTKDINSVVDYIDSIYSEDECVKLFKVIKEFHDFPNITLTVRELHRALTEVVYYPLTRLRGTAKRQILIDSITALIVNHKMAPHIARRLHVHKANARTKFTVRSIFKPVVKSSPKYYTDLNNYKSRKAIYRTYTKRKLSNGSQLDVIDINSPKYSGLTTYKIINKTNPKRKKSSRKFSKVELMNDFNNYKIRRTTPVDIYDDEATIITPACKLKRRTTKMFKYRKDHKVVFSAASITTLNDHQNVKILKNKLTVDENIYFRENAFKKDKPSITDGSDKQKNRQIHKNIARTKKKIVKVTLRQPKLSDMSLKHYKHNETILLRHSNYDSTKLDELIMKYKDIENKYENLVKLYEKKFNVTNIIKSNNVLVLENL